MKVSTRAAAKALGKRKYFTGKPCVHGHIAERYIAGDCVPCHALKQATWDKKHPEVGRRKARRWKAKNPEHAKAYERAWYAADPSKRLTLNRNRRARLVGSHTAQDIKQIVAAQRWKCPYCRQSLADGYHVDHIVPLVAGGRNDKSNLQALCPTCNLKKGAKDPVIFARAYGFLF